MRILTFVLLLFSCSTMAQDEDHSLGIMGASDVLCSAYLRFPPGTAEREQLDYWVNGRIVAIVPARVQPFLRAQSWTRFQKDLTAMCERWGGEDLFIASALLANEYKMEADRDPRYRPQESE